MSTSSQEELLWGFQACNYSAMGALAFTTWDIMITVGDEVQILWRKPWSRVRAVYLLLRAYSWLAQVLATIGTLKLATSGTLSSRGCEALELFQGASSEALMVTCQYILIIRVVALYRNNRTLRLFLFFLYASEILAMTFILALVQPKIKYGPYCVTVAFPIGVAGFFVTPLMIDTLLFVLTMIKFYQIMREGWGQVHLISSFIKDGIWAYALTLSITLINACCLLFIDGSLSSVAYAWYIAIPPFAGYRLILNMNYLFSHSGQGYMVPNTDSSGIALDTLAATHPPTSESMYSEMHNNVIEENRV